MTTYIYIYISFSLFLLCRPGFAPTPFHVRFVVDQMALKQFFLRVIWFPLPIQFHVAPYSSSCTFCSYEKEKRAKLSKSNAFFVIGEHRIKKLFSVIKVFIPGRWLSMCLQIRMFSFFISLRIPCRLVGCVSDLWTINYRLCSRRRNRSSLDCGWPGRRGD